MKRARVVGALILVVAFSLSAHADQAGSAFKRGVQAESKNNYDEAFQKYSEAHDLKPRDPKYFAAFTRMRFYAATEHVRKGQLLRDQGKLQEAGVEFQKAADIDPTNFAAKGEARRIEELIKKQQQQAQGEAARKELPLDKLAQEAAGPVELQPLSNTLINLRLTENATMVYKTIARLAGINVLFDQDYKTQKITVELNDVTLREALNTVALQTKTFWSVVSSNTILVAADTTSKRKEMENTVMKTFYLKNVSTPSELQEAATTLKSILDVNRIQLIPNQNALILRGTTDQMVLAQKLITDLDKPKPEVVIDIAILQVSRARLRTLGVSPPTSANVVMVPGTTTGNAGNGGSGGSPNGSFTINSLRNLTANNFQVSIPGASLSYLMSDSDTKLIQNPEIRALDNEKATLKIGDRVPIATGSFGAAGGLGGVSALVNTQFQYLDVGVNIDITPRVHAEGEVTLKMTLEVSSVSGTQNIGGISQPVIGQRRIEHETRLRDGEVNLVGGILEDTESNSLSGYPWLTRIPILKYLFGQEEKDRRENEIIFAITPHIIRAQEVTDDNLRLVDLGRGSSVSVGHTDPRDGATSKGLMDQSAANKGQGRTQGQRTTVPATAPSRSVEAPKTPAQMPVPTATTIPVRPATASLQQSNPAMPAAAPPANTPPPRPVAQVEISPPPRASLQAENFAMRPQPQEQDIPPVHPASQAHSNPAAASADRTSVRALKRPAAAPASTEQCPTGTHLVGTENGVINCSFD
ncbi:MAG TPA: secretin N-terminal domain-containing protein [Candidatus Sulfotelmatobacter sp.]